MANGFESVAIRLRSMSDEATRVGGPKAAEAMARVLVHGVTTNELRRFSHPAGTPTPSPAGQPPAKVTGALARSIRQNPVSGARQVGPHRFQTEAGPTIIYGRIHELGGLAGKNHRTRLPARPYLAPATLRLRGQIGDAGVKAFAKAVSNV